MQIMNKLKIEDGLDTYFKVGPQQILISKEISITVKRIGWHYLNHVIRIHCYCQESDKLGSGTTWQKQKKDAIHALHPRIFLRECRPQN